MSLNPKFAAALRLCICLGICLGPGIIARAEGVPHELSAEKLAALGAQSTAGGHQTLAIYYYLQALEKQPGRNDWRLWVAQALQKRGNDEAALEQARRVLSSQPANAKALAIVEELTRVKPVKSAAQIEKEEDAIAVSSVPFPEKSAELLPKALGAWIVGNPSSAVQKINAHNLGVPKSQQFYYFFVDGGSIGGNADKLALSFDAAPAIALSDSIAGDSMVFPVITGLTRAMAKAGKGEWERIAQEIAAKLESDKRISGVLFDIKPHESMLHFMYASVKKLTRKPVMAVGGERLTFKYVDVGVFKCFDFPSLGEDPLEPGPERNPLAATIPDIRIYAGNVDSGAGQFLKNARANGGKALIGIPLIATSHEYESVAKSAGGEKIQSGLRMDMYIGNAVGWVEHAVQVNDDAFLGLAIWAIHPEGGVHRSGDKSWYFPSVLSEEQWQRLKTPLIRR